MPLEEGKRVFALYIASMIGKQDSVISKRLEVRLLADDDAVVMSTDSDRRMIICEDKDVLDSIIKKQQMLTYEKGDLDLDGEYRWQYAIVQNPTI